ncbi:ABC transporter permease [Jiangella endophytica]|uniref:ABC transporter permease n=1 Tax=Jiangella endophytica TaxID=1623398 RepID=UPI000E354D5C|nr:ABC transporter permease [Jiangella endophytica]
MSAVATQLVRRPSVVAGTLMTAATLFVAFAGPALAGSPDEFVGAPFQGPGGDAPLGTDVMGRSVLARLLAGGRDFLLQGILAAALGVGAGVLLGVALASASRRVADLVLSLNDTVIVLPQIVIALLVLTRLGATPLTLVLVVGIVHVPQSARVVRAATQRVVTQDYYDSARTLGASRRRLFTGEVLPNIAGVVLLELSIRLAISVVVLASLSYLGFGSTDTQWGRMIHENQGGLTIQPWAVLAPVICTGVFLIGVNLLRGGTVRALAVR